MSVKQNAIIHSQELPLATKAVHRSFYVDDGLVGAESVEEAVCLQAQLQDLLARGVLSLHKWKSSKPNVLEHVPYHLLDPLSSQPLPDPDNFTKTLGIEWSANLDCFRLSVSQPPSHLQIIKRMLVPDIAKVHDILGWFAPSVIQVKMMLQCL